MSKQAEKTGLLLGIENSAISLLSDAVKYDHEKRYSEALACYRQGIGMFLELINKTSDKPKQELLRNKVTEYLARAEKIKETIGKSKTTNTFHEQIQIPDNGIGYSYEKLLQKYLDKTITKAEVDDPYIRTTHQAYNFLSFCEMLVKFCSTLKEIQLITGFNEQDHNNQKSHLESIKNSLSEYGIELNIEYSPTLHDREIRLNNGFVIKIGRGLDYFKQTKKFTVGFCDQSLRKCHETTVDVFKKAQYIS